MESERELAAVLNIDCKRDEQFLVGGGFYKAEASGQLPPHTNAKSHTVGAAADDDAAAAATAC